MLDAMRIANFKAFGHEQGISLRPITLVYGPNSAGKSTLIHSLLYAKEAQRSNSLDIRRTEAGGESVDLGGFRQYVHRHDANRAVRLGFSVTPEKARRLRSISVDAAVGLPRVNNQIVYNTGPVLLSATLASGDPVVTLTTDVAGAVRIADLNFGHALFQELEARELGRWQSVMAREQDVGLSHGDYERVLLGAEVVVDGLLPVGLRSKDSRAPGAANEGRVAPPFLARFVDSEYTATEAIARAVNRLLQTLSAPLESLLGGATYLGPLRAFPPRHMGLVEELGAQWEAGGGRAWDLLREDANLRAAVNSLLESRDWLGTGYRLVSRHLVDAGQLQEHFHKALQKLSAEYDVPEYADEDVVTSPATDRFLSFVLEGDWLEEVGASEELSLIDTRLGIDVSHYDVGTGVSQVLPVLAASESLRRTLVCIEQPEIHLHPRLQGNLADVIIRSVRNNRNQFLLETHSENLLLRIMRRIREESRSANPSLTSDDVSVLYVHPEGPDGASIVLPLQLSDDGSLLDPWPDGFFEDGFNDRFCG